MRLYGIYDKVSGHYLAWLVEANEGTCIRKIQSHFKQTEFEDFCSDFTLSELASLDDNFGTVIPNDAPKLLCRLDEIFTPVVSEDN